MKRSAPNTNVSPATGARWRRIGLWLVGTTLAYNIIEGILAIWAGVQASSIALVGFGLDSFIECAEVLKRWQFKTCTYLLPPFFVPLLLDPHLLKTCIAPSPTCR